MLGPDATPGQFCRDRPQRPTRAAQAYRQADNGLLCPVCNEVADALTAPATLAYAEPERHRPARFEPLGAHVPQRCARPVSDRLAFQFPESRHEREEKSPHTRAGVEPFRDRMQRDVTLSAQGSDIKRISRASDQSIKFADDEPIDLAAADEIQDLQCGWPARGVLAAQACVAVDPLETEPVNLAVRNDLFALSAQGNAFGSLLPGGDSGVRDHGWRRRFHFGFLGGASWRGEDAVEDIGLPLCRLPTQVLQAHAHKGISDTSDTESGWKVEAPPGAALL